jgi:hypothetical protein
MRLSMVLRVSSRLISTTRNGCATMDRLIVIAKGEIKIKVARQLRSGDVERNEPIIQALINLMIEHRLPSSMRPLDMAKASTMASELLPVPPMAAGLLATTVLSHKWATECIAALTGYHAMVRFFPPFWEAIRTMPVRPARRIRQIVPESLPAAADYRAFVQDPD